MELVKLNYDIIYEGGEKILKINASSYPRIATLEEDPIILSLVLSKIYEDPSITSIEIEQEDLISYYENTVNLLRELAFVYYKLKPHIGELYSYLLTANPFYHEYKKLINLLDKEYLKDPIGVFVSVKRLYRKINVILSKNKDLENTAIPLINVISNFIQEFQSTTVYKIIKDFLSGHKPGNREIYKRLFIGDIRPKFVSIKYFSKIDEDAEIIETYNIDENTEVIIFKKPDEMFFRYYIFPEEYQVYKEESIILNKVREILIQYQPKREDYLDVERMREVHDKIISSIIDDVSKKYNIYLSDKRKNIIKSILIRYSIGFGILEKIAKDERVQDIFVNPPPGLSPISLQHADYDLCITNVIPTRRELESWATKLRLISGRPFDESNPVLDTEIFLGDTRLRVAAIMEPLSPKGLSYVFRRHRTKPWTLPLFIENKMINSLAAGLLSFFVANGRTILIAGTRGAGKTSLLTALMLEIPRKVRIITVEDTLEIPVDYFKKLGYNIVPMKVRSPFALQTTELSAEDGIRVSLRLGDSAIVVGEVRSKEARTLYEAMRVGALANAVLGTIHAESPYGVYDRVVNDLGVPITSFKATDIVVIANPIKDPSGIRKYRRVLRITEVRKHWSKDPVKERGFVDLMIYDPDKDSLLPTSNLLNGDSDILKSIASRTKYLSKSWEKIWNMIEILAKEKELIVEYAKNTGNRDLLEANFTIVANETLYKIINDSIEEFGDIDKEYILEKFEQWLRKYAR